MTTREELVERIQAAGLGRVQRSLLGALRNAIRVTTASNVGVMELGASRIGGAPDLPEGENWPERGGRPLAFLAQFRMRDVAPHDPGGVLPSHGMLYFFYDAEEQPWGEVNDRSGWKVFLRDHEALPMERKALPSNLPDEGRFALCAVRFSAETTMPSYESQLVQEIGLTDDEQEAYTELLGELGADETGRHRLLGHPDDIQGEMETQCEQESQSPHYSIFPEGGREVRLRELAERVKRWRLLLQLDSDEGAGMMWADTGRLYFWIPEDSLRARNFDDAWLVLQCY